ncbi:MAG: HAD family phosphatase [Clostridia bacterium]|nr:HAD family phosphatase [Clostridia bacterium]MDE7328797.1 HAD family phosphatase [Clostridia bacterium]
MIKLFEKEIKGAIFDLDGTLLDSMWVWEKVDEDFLIENGLPLTPDYTAAVREMHFEEAALYTKTRYSLPLSTDDIKNRWIDMVKDEYAHNIKLKEGAYDFIKLLIKNDVRVAFATTLFCEVAKLCLKNNGLTYEKLKVELPLTTIEEVTRGKGYPDIYLRAAQKIDLQPCECMVFEDIPLAIKGAKAGGFHTCGVYDEYSNYGSEFEQICTNYIKNYGVLLNSIEK